MHLKYRWLVALGLLGFALVAWLLWAMNETRRRRGRCWSPTWSRCSGSASARGWCWSPGSCRASRRGEPAAVGVYSRVLVAVAILAVGGPIAAVLLVALFTDMENPEVAAGLGGLSILSAAAVAIVGAVLAPWFFLVTRTLARERARRVRAEERAEVAAHLHDSVLQALTLIQKHADDSPSVRRLARGTERELRGWLYGSPPAPAGDDFAAAVRAAAEEVEDRFDVAVELVAVGTCPLDGPARAVVGAVREALTNAAKHAAGAPGIGLHRGGRRRDVRPGTRPGTRLRSGRPIRRRPARHRRLDRGADGGPGRHRGRALGGRVRYRGGTAHAVAAG